MERPAPKGSFRGQSRADRVFLSLLAILLIVGLAALVSASAPLGYSKFNDTYYFVKRQVLYGLLPGLAVFLILARIDYRRWSKLAWPFYIFSLLLLIAVFIPELGLSYGKNVSSWLGLGPLSFQPSELAKIALAIVLAKFLSEPRRDLFDWRQGVLPALAAAAPALVLILLQPDIGTLAIFAGMVFGLLYLAGTPKIHLLVIGALGVAAFAAMILFAPYRLQRLTIFMHPELDPQGIGYHVNQAFLAVGSGGWWGMGYGHSRQKYLYLPEVQADSVFAVFAEEMGFVISAGLIFLILLLAWRGLKIAKSAPDQFGALLAGGIVIWFFWQSLVNLGAMVGILPLTGVPLPLVSHGGTAMVVMLAAFGIIANISRQTKVR